jgi:hypothetical protein
VRLFAGQSVSKNNMGQRATSTTAVLLHCIKRDPVESPANSRQAHAPLSHISINALSHVRNKKVDDQLWFCNSDFINL